MLAPFLMGLVGGQRAMTPIAAVSLAAMRNGLPADNGAPRIIAHPLVVAALVGLAAAELAGDKMKTAPDRVVPVGLVARFITSAVVGAALTPSRQRWLGAAVGGVSGVAASYFGWRARMASIPQYGHTSTGLVEDGIVIASAVMILRRLARTAG
jgi:uncharacterized membrane protein